METVFRVDVGYDMDRSFTFLHFMVHEEKAEKFVNKYIFFKDRRLLVKGKTATYFDTREKAEQFAMEIGNRIADIYTENSMKIKNLVSSYKS